MIWKSFLSSPFFPHLSFINNASSLGTSIGFRAGIKPDIFYQEDANIGLNTDLFGVFLGWRYLMIQGCSTGVADVEIGIEVCSGKS